MSLLKNAASLLCLASVVTTVSAVSAVAIPADAAGAPASSCFAAPDASAVATVRGRTLSTLHAYDGKVFYGYGDYDAKPARRPRRRARTSPTSTPRRTISRSPSRTSRRRRSTPSVR
ncbi:hypothetical protein [Nocardioides daphniae]|uniref:Uncharacterized protein n=1 Tax=Nocardioides daphniae TaxID=402297 RepID=A0A4P7UA47_9ACTN|nr:hypothetical protein [Nocardioides daphniae]QCC76098.1 hypothetical protein E2C04_00800 [Nocardioides daphniae]